MIWKKHNAARNLILKGYDDMIQTLLSQFPVSEYEARLEKVLAGMEKAGIDALILTSDENTYYFTGFRSIVWDSKVSILGTLVITKDGGMAFATSQGAAKTAAGSCCVEDMRIFGEDGYPSYTKAIVSLLEEKGLKKGKIGFEFGDGQKIHLNYNLLQELFEELKDAERVEAASLLWEVRCVKSPLEIVKLREACEINIKSIQKGFDGLYEGMTEMELYGLIMSEYYRLGAERTLPIGLRAGEDRYSHVNSPPSYRPIMKGDIILVDGGPVYHGYYSDIIRQAVIGKPTDLQQEMFDVAREACYKGIEAVKPGIPICEVSKAVEQYMENSKFSEYHTYANRGTYGHSIGVGVHEFPMISHKSAMPLQAGMTFAIEPYFYKEGVGSLGIEENILVTENGCEILTPSDSTLMRR